MKKYAHDTLERIRMYCPGTPVVIDNDLDEPFEMVLDSRGNLKRIIITDAAFDELLSLSPEEVEGG